MQLSKSLHVVSRLIATPAARLILSNSSRSIRETTITNNNSQQTTSTYNRSLITVTAAVTTAFALSSPFAQSDASTTPAPVPPTSNNRHDWKSVVAALRESQRTDGLGASFLASRHSLPSSTSKTKSYAHDVEFPLTRDADIHAIVSALTYCHNKGTWLRINDSPTRRDTLLSSGDGTFEASICVPRISSLDGRVTIKIIKEETELFSDDEIHALVSAYQSSQRKGLSPHLLDGTFSVDVGPPSYNTKKSPPPQTKSDGRFIIRRQIDDIDDDDNNEDEDEGEDENDMNLNDKRKNARAKLEELGVDVFDIQEDENKINWDSLAGYQDVKQRIENTLILPLKHPQVYKKIIKGTRIKNNDKNYDSIPKAVLFYGPPGTGKTMSARILSSSLNIPFIHVRVETLLSKYYGETTKKMADVLENANKLGKCIVFLDECDSVGLKRESNDSSGGVHEVTRRTLSVLLRFIDGIEGSKDAIILAATNCKNDLDSALISRFDVIVEFPLPDEQSRIEMLKLYAKQLNQEDVCYVARRTWGFSGRELVDVCEEAERSRAGEIVRQKEKEKEKCTTKDINVEDDEGLPTIDDYVKAVESKEEHVVGRWNERFAKPEVFRRLIGKNHVGQIVDDIRTDEENVGDQKEDVRGDDGDEREKEM